MNSYQSIKNDEKNEPHSKWAKEKLYVSNKYIKMWSTSMAVACKQDHSERLFWTHQTGQINWTKPHAREGVEQQELLWKPARLLRKQPGDASKAEMLRAPWWLSGKERACDVGAAGRRRFNSWARTVPWRRTQQPTPGLLSGEAHGQRSLAASVQGAAGSRALLKWLGAHANCAEVLTQQFHS